MSAILTVCRKEIVETLRDRRTLVSLLLGPLLRAVRGADQHDGDAQPDLARGNLTARCSARSAPNLVVFLNARASRAREHGVTNSTGDHGRSHRPHDVVLLVDEEFVTEFIDVAARDAGFRPLEARAVSAGARRDRRYGQQIGTLRFWRAARPSLLRPLIVDELDVSTPASRSALMLGVLTYFLLFATLTGGLHLAIDTTAGERERKSLEPLLTLPVARSSLLIGKMLATVCYMLSSLALTLVAFTIALKQMPLEQIGMSSTFGFATSVVAFLLLAPFAPLGAALMTTVASFTKPTARRRRT
jgi:sodium transport system permease protein